MLFFATEGITSMSVKPIRMIATLGILVFLFSIGVLVYTVIRKFTGYTVPGWAFLAVSIWALGGVQLLAIGVIGEYIGKIYLETKGRPRFIISDYLKDD
jgi:glycosyltransferase involved in cell wall biosynthesis